MGGLPTQQQVMQQQQQAQAQEEQRKELLQRILTPEALERIKRIELVKPEKVSAWTLRSREPACCSRCRVHACR